MRRRATYLVATLALAGLTAVAVAQKTQGTTGGGGARITGAGENAGSGLPLDRWQPKRLPSLPSGMTLDMVRGGDSLFHGKAGCVTCHGPDGFGMNDAGSAITMGLSFIPAQWHAIDSLVTAGIPEALTRSSVAMPPRGVGQNLTPEETRTVAAYVWAIANTADEPWPGGHRTHAASGTSASTGAAAGSDTAAAGKRAP